MPVINFNYHDLCRLLGQEIPFETLLERIPMMGADMQDSEGEQDDMSVEFFPDRPDLFCVEGIARSLRAFLGMEEGLPSYEVQETDIELKVEESVLGVRPLIACAVVYGLEIDDELIRSLMEAQEKLHVSIGRKRSKLAIGVHDLDKVKAPFRYLGIPPEGLRFIPLGWEEEMSLGDVLVKHEKGKEFAHLLEGEELYPVILDADDQVLSFPPVINGALTTVTEDSVNLFIDVTGTDSRAVEGALNIMATALVERGGRLGSVRLSGAADAVYPNLEPSEWVIPIEECRQLLSPSLSPEDMRKGLERMGMGATIEGESIRVLVPPTRLDILHPVDIMEDVAIGHGFEQFGSPAHTLQTVGTLLPMSRASERVRELMTGLGYSEVTTLMLSSEKEEFELTGIAEESLVTVLNPITEDHTCLRRNLRPSLLRILRRNRHRDLPQRIFEVGDVLVEGRRRKHLAGMSIHAKASFTEAKSQAEALLREMSLDYEVSSSADGIYVPGRGADIIVDGKKVGSFGELAPKVIVNFELGYPIAAFEMDLEALLADKGDSLF